MNFAKESSDDLDHKVSDVIGRRLKKYINHSFEPYFSGTSGFNLMSRYLYDRCETLIHICHSAGSSLSRVLAGMAKVELGNLRDSRFITPLLESENYEYRINAAACLAFLQIPEHNHMLFELTMNDPDPGVRQVALWACAFRTDVDFQEILKKIQKSENHRNVFDLAHRLSEESALSV